MIETVKKIRIENIPKVKVTILLYSDGENYGYIADKL